MRRLLATTVVALAALAAPAAAEHHLVRVDEVFPSPGNPAASFVELRDPVSEPFEFGPFGLAAFDAANSPVSSQEIPEPVPFARSTQPFVYGGSAVSGRGADLTMSVPPDTARVCFTDSAGPLGCLQLAGVALQPGQSAQRQSPCGVVAAAPTPNAPNAPCGASGGGGSQPGGGGGGETGGPGGGGDTTGDVTVPTAKLGGRARQDVDRLAIRVELSEAATLTVSGRVSVPRSRAAATFRLKSVRREVRAGQRVTVRLKLSRRGRTTVKAAIRRGLRVRARVKVSARDGAGNEVTRRRSVRLTD
jgi:hypothetical protein